MSGYRQGLLSSASYGTVAFAAGLTRKLETGKGGSKLAKSRKKKARSLVASAVGAGALAIAVGLTAAPQGAWAAGAATCATISGGLGWRLRSFCYGN